MLINCANNLLLTFQVDCPILYQWQIQGSPDGRVGAPTKYLQIFSKKLDNFFLNFTRWGGKGGASLAAPLDVPMNIWLDINEKAPEYFFYKWIINLLVILSQWWWKSRIRKELNGLILVPRLNKALTGSKVPLRLLQFHQALHHFTICTVRAGR